MAQIHDATMARNVKMPLNDKLKLLCKLKGSIHFEKILTASSAYSNNLHGPSTLALPSWFVQEHGDKFRKYVILRTELSTKAWSVTLTVFHKSPTVSGNPKKLPSQLASKRWPNDFGLPRKKAKQYSYECKREPLLSGEESNEGAVKSNEWISQKRKIGEQRAVSAFGHSPTSLRNSSYSKDSKSNNMMDPTFIDHHHDSNKGQEPALVHDELMVPASANGGRKHPGNEYIQGPTIRKKLNELMAQKKAVGEQRIVCGFGHNPTSLRNSSYSNDVHLLDPKNMTDSPSRDHHDSNNGQEPALDHEELMVQSGVTGEVPSQHTGGRKDAGDQNQGFPEDFTLQKIPMNFPLSAGFLKQLTVSNFYRCEGAEGGGKTACMEIPVVFWRTYGSRLHSLVKLQGIREDSQVRTMACLPILQGDQTWRIYLRAGWRDFADANSLKVGQVLEFTLTADSFFVVRRANS